MISTKNDISFDVWSRPLKLWNGNVDGRELETSVPDATISQSWIWTGRLEAKAGIILLVDCYTHGIEGLENELKLNVWHQRG